MKKIMTDILAWGAAGLITTTAIVAFSAIFVVLALGAYQLGLSTITPKPSPSKADPPGDPRRSGHGGGVGVAELEKLRASVAEFVRSEEAQANALDINNSSRDQWLEQLGKVEGAVELKDIVDCWIDSFSSATNEPEESGA